ncbi:short chain dehydrogenase [Rhodococcus oxybenzonivorans]|uniref:Short chain dehydrogenase n=1 Tax=Rhodococcus oxybenzonivorans TaxID=1990687 RepID=A0A2S2BPC2_9NOCA|nr:MULTISPECIES: SDR family oxidoreductase [Rhodococcus]AWK70476.1 short chain dehydrogenase [Rhodococcus oxybenzonivorans]QTJ66631.1 SDR family oxidoreductase [Rhodococcus sp. ZPP]
MDLQLKDRTYLVTGGSSGVGLATVAMLLEEGANVVTCARDRDRLDSVIAPLPGSDRVLTASCDVRDPAAVAALVEAGVERFGGLDGLVNNAGKSRMVPRGEATLDDWRDELDLKFSSVLNTVEAALPLLRKSDAAAIVNISAVLARQPEPRLVTTSAARAGLLNLSKSLSLELAADGIRVNSVSLGLVDTGQWRRRYEESGTDATFAEWEAEIAQDRGIGLGRFGRADEVAAMIVTLLSPRSSYVTGTSLDVCGGVARYV